VFTTTEPSPLGGDDSIHVVDSAVEAQAQARLEQWRAARDDDAVAAALAALAATAATTDNLMEASLACARAGVTTGEWSQVLRDVFGEFRAPTGVSGVVGVAPATDELTAVRNAVASTGDELGVHLRMLVGKPGLDGHSNGAEQIAVRARDAGFEVVYQGIRLTPEQIVSAAVAEDVDVVGLSILSGSHLELVPMVLEGLRAAGMAEVPIVVGGIIPDADAVTLKASGVAAVFTPKDYDATLIMAKVLDEIRSARGLARLLAG
jgi:(2R)-ethylmalonyl-CoA mutase